MGSSAELLSLSLTKRARMLDLVQARLLGMCSRFAPLEAHAERLAKSTPPGTADAPAILDALRTLAAKGLMLSRSAFMNRVASVTSSD